MRISGLRCLSRLFRIQVYGIKNMRNAIASLQGIDLNRFDKSVAFF